MAEILKFRVGQSMRRQVVGQPNTARVERVSFTLWGNECHNDTVEFSDGTWLSYCEDYGWRYFYPTGPLLGAPVDVHELGFAQPSYWRRFVQQLVQSMGLFLLVLMLASCTRTLQPKPPLSFAAHEAHTEMRTAQAKRIINAHY